MPQLKLGRKLPGRQNKIKLQFQKYDHSKNNGFPNTPRAKYTVDE